MDSETTATKSEWDHAVEDFKVFVRFIGRLVALFAVYAPLMFLTEWISAALWMDYVQITMHLAMLATLFYVTGRHAFRKRRSSGSWF